MARRLVLVFAAVLVLQLVAFRYLNRELFWIARAEAAQAPVAVTREAAVAALARRKLSRQYAEAVIRATDRSGLRDIRLATLARLARAYPDEVALQLRYAEALRLDGRLTDAARVFARVAEGR